MIVFDHVGKRYRSWRGRDVDALLEFSVEIRPDEVFGIAGPNGAGKSTLIALLLGFLGPTTGEVRIDGLAPRRYVERGGVGYLSELVNIPPAWRVTSVLRRYGTLAGVPAHRLDERVEWAIASLGLEEHRGKRVRQLSKGNLQRLGLAQALLGEARMIVLDEPTHGLDPLWTQRFRDVVEGLRRPDRAIVIASHNLDELARLADRVAIMDHGRLQRVVDVRSSERAVTDHVPYRLVLAGNVTGLQEIFPGARAVAASEFELTGLPLHAINHGLVQLIEGGANVRSLYPVHSALEQQFREAVASAESADLGGRA